MHDNLAGRQSNIELLRIFAILGVIILHYNNVDVGGGLRYVIEKSTNYYMLYFLESLTICAVDLFMLISGYFLSTSKRRNLWKPIELIAQVVLFNLGITLLRSVISGSMPSVNAVIGCFIPANYFVILYIAVYLISPYINILIERLSSKQLDGFMLLLFGMFSVYPTLVDMFIAISGRDWMGLSTIGMYGSQRGYTIVNFTLMYIIGAYIRNHGIKQNTKTLSSIGMLACIVLLTIWAFFDKGTAWEYCNPIVILVAVFAFNLFMQIEMGCVKIINQLAKGTFSVFLLHSVFLPHIAVDRFVIGNPLVMILHIGISTIGIFLICWVAYCVYSAVTKPVFHKMAQRIHLPDIDVSV